MDNNRTVRLLVTWMEKIMQGNDLFNEACILFTNIFQHLKLKFLWNF